MNKEEKTITLGNELYEEFIEGKQTIDTHELLNLFAKRINNLQSKIDKAINKLESLLPMCIMPNNMLIHGTEKAKAIEKALNVLKEDK